MLSEHNRARLLATFGLEQRPLEFTVARELEECVTRLHKQFDPSPRRLLPIDLMQFRSRDDNTYTITLQAYRYFPHMFCFARIERIGPRQTRISGETTIALFGLRALIGATITAITYTVFLVVMPLLWFSALFAIIGVVVYWAFMRYSRGRLIKDFMQAMQA